MHIVIAGCGRVGSALAGWLADDGHDVVVIDKDQHAVDSLGKAFNGLALVGEAFDVGVLEEANIHQADAFAAVTNNDNANLMAVEVARDVFSVPRVIARLYDPAREETYRRLGIRHVTGTKLIANVFYEQIQTAEFDYHVTFTDGDVEIVEFVLNERTRGVSVGDLEVTNKLRIAAIQRKGETIIPRSRHALEPGDLIVAAARKGVHRRLDQYIVDKKG